MNLNEDNLFATVQKRVGVGTCPQCDSELVGVVNCTLTIPEDKIPTGDSSTKVSVKIVADEFELLSHFCEKVQLREKFVTVDSADEDDRRPARTTYENARRATGYNSRVNRFERR